MEPRDRWEEGDYDGTAILSCPTCGNWWELLDTPHCTCVLVSVSVGYAPDEAFLMVPLVKGPRGEELYYCFCEKAVVAHKEEGAWVVANNCTSCGRIANAVWGWGRGASTISGLRPTDATPGEYLGLRRSSYPAPPSITKESVALCLEKIRERLPAIYEFDYKASEELLTAKKISMSSRKMRIPLKFYGGARGGGKTRRR